MTRVLRRLRSVPWAVGVIGTLGLAVLGLGLAAQVPDVPAGRVLAQPAAPPGIDRGVLDELPARAVRGPRDGSGGRRTAAGASPARPYVPGRVVVRFREGGAAAAVRALAARGLAAPRLIRPSWADFDLLEIDPSLDPEAVAAELAARPDVEYAQASYRVYAYFRPNDPLYDRQWNFQAIGMEQAWDINPGASSDVIVAVLDSGLAYRNAIYEFIAPAFVDNGVRYPALGRITVPFAEAPELAGPNRFVSPRDFIWDDTEPVDMDGHGTHVAGTIGQLTNNGVGVAGMAFNVRFMPVKVIAGDWDDIFDSPFVGTDDVVARGIRYAADNGAKVINMSLGRTGPPAPVVGAAIRYAVSRGAFVAVAAGNGYEDGNPTEAIAEEAAPIDGAMVVGAVGPDGNQPRRAFYSSVKPAVEIAAPGGDLRRGGAAAGIYQQTFDPAFSDTFALPPSLYRAPRFDAFAYRPFQGTSMATPHVAGLAALLYTQGITRPAAIEAAIKRFATDLGPPGRDDEYGHGLINPRATLRGLGLIR
jgi:serine protease